MKENWLKELFINEAKPALERHSSTGTGSTPCDGDHIITVSELPTENIDTNTLYKLVNKSLANIVVKMEGQTFFVSDIAGEASVSFYYVDTKPVTDIVISTDVSMHMYYVEDENDIFLYGDFEGTGEPAWVLMSLMLGVPYGGFISDVTQVTTDGYYAVGSNDENLYKNNKNRFLDIIAGGSSITDHYANQGMSCRFYYVTTAPASDNTDFVTAGALNFCYVEDEDTILVNSGDSGWSEFTNLVGQQYVGVISDPSQAQPEGMYAVITGGWMMYGTCSGTLSITENGSYDVSRYVNAEVKVISSSSYIVQSPEDLPADAYDGSFAIVLGGGDE